MRQVGDRSVDVHCVFVQLSFFVGQHQGKTGFGEVARRLYRPDAKATDTSGSDDFGQPV